MMPHTKGYRYYSLKNLLYGPYGFDLVNSWSSHSQCEQINAKGVQGLQGEAQKGQIDMKSSKDP